MNINSKMIELLQTIISKEPEYAHSLTENEFVSEDVGSELIQIYQATNNLETRELITGFMQEAGYNWLRRLMTRDTMNQAV